MNRMAMQALEVSWERSHQRAEFRRQLQAMRPKTARHHVARELGGASPLLLSTRLITLLAWLPRLGTNLPGGRAGVVDRLFAHLGVRAVDKRVGELTDRQRGLLIEWLENGR